MIVWKQFYNCKRNEIFINRIKLSIIMLLKNISYFVHSYTHYVWLSYPNYCIVLRCNTYTTDKLKAKCTYSELQLLFLNDHECVNDSEEQIIFPSSFLSTRERKLNEYITISCKKRQLLNIYIYICICMEAYFVVLFVAIISTRSTTHRLLISSYVNFLLDECCNNVLNALPQCESPKREFRGTVCASMVTIIFENLMGRT